MVGFQEGMTVARSSFPDVVICDYDLLVAAPLADWERDPILSEVPIIAVSLTRRPEEAHFVDTNGIAGFLYLPLVEDDAAVRMVKAACTHSSAGGERMHGVRVPDSAFRWPQIDEPERVEHE